MTGRGRETGRWNTDKQTDRGESTTGRGGEVNRGRETGRGRYKHIDREERRERGGRKGCVGHERGGLEREERGGWKEGEGGEGEGR